MIHLEFCEVVGEDARSTVAEQVWVAAFVDACFLERIADKFGERAVVGRLAVVDCADVCPQRRVRISLVGMAVQPR